MNENPSLPNTKTKSPTVEVTESEMATLKSEMATLKSEMATLKSEMATLKSEMAALRSAGETRRTPETVSKTEFKEAARTIEKTLQEIKEVAEAFSTWASECAQIADQTKNRDSYAQIVSVKLVDSSDVNSLIKDIIVLIEENLNRLRTTTQDALQEADTTFNLGLINKFHPDNLSPQIFQTLPGTIRVMFLRGVVTPKLNVLEEQAKKLTFIKRRVHFSGLEKWFGCLDDLRVGRPNVKSCYRMPREIFRGMLNDGYYTTGFAVNIDGQFEEPMTICVGG